jgi:hypothetical protein
MISCSWENGQITSSTNTVHMDALIYTRMCIHGQSRLMQHITEAINVSFKAKRHTEGNILFKLAWVTYITQISLLLWDIQNQWHELFWRWNLELDRHFPIVCFTLFVQSMHENDNVQKQDRVGGKLVLIGNNMLHFFRIFMWLWKKFIPWCIYKLVHNVNLGHTKASGGTRKVILPSLFCHITISHHLPRTHHEM